MMHEQGTLIVILAAGRGSRMEGLPDDVNKCAFPIRDGITPLLHTVRAFATNGATHFCVTVGHAAESVRKALEPVEGAYDIHFVENSLFASTGCNYSLARAVASGLADDVNRIIVIEGDSLLPAESIGQMLHSDFASAVLVRAASYINPERSVVALGQRGKVLRFAYDAQHRDVLAFDGPREGEAIFGESMQIWSFGGEALAVVKDIFSLYDLEPDSSLRPFLDESLLISLDTRGSAMRPLRAVRSGDWINMNTRADAAKAERSLWLME